MYRALANRAFMFRAAGVRSFSARIRAHTRAHTWRACPSKPPVETEDSHERTCTHILAAGFTPPSEYADLRTSTPREVVLTDTRQTRGTHQYVPSVESQPNNRQTKKSNKKQ
jgi:hypothetical protein